MRISKLTAALVVFTLFFLKLPLHAQDTEPTYSETVDWIRNKIEKCKANIIQKSFLDEIKTGTDYILVKKRSDNWTYTYKIRFRDITGYKLYNGAYDFELYSSEKKIWYYEEVDGKNHNGYSYVNTIRLGLDEITEENFHERFEKALKKLISYNTKNKTKEAF